MTTAQTLPAELKARGISVREMPGSLRLRPHARIPSDLLERLRPHKAAQELARHSTPTLTLGRYAHVQLVDQTRALDALLSIAPTRADDAALAATGTDDAVAVADEPPPARSALAARRRPGTPQAAITGQDGEGEEDGQGNAHVVANATTCAQLSTYVNEAGGGIRTPNPRFTKPETPSQNSSDLRELRQGDFKRAAPGAARRRPEAQTQHNAETQTPPDLGCVVAAWPGLPEHIKAAVLALVKTTEV